MHNNLKTVGSPSIEELESTVAFPKEVDYKNGPVAFIECIEEIPCNPCERACRRNAITIGNPITNLPKIDMKKCTGCGLCVAACPGLAIYIKDYTYSETTATISFPFEYLPLPDVGDSIILVNRLGEKVCQGKIIKISNLKVNDSTTVITAEYSKEYFEQVISMERL